MATAMDLEKLAQRVKSEQQVLKQHDSKKSKSKCWETFSLFSVASCLVSQGIFLSASGRVAGLPGQVLPGLVGSRVS